jgi:hypothetical protein
MPEFAPTFETVIGVVVASVFVALLIFETRFSLRQPKRPKAQRFVINIGVSAFALATAAYVVGPSLSG